MEFHTRYKLLILSHSTEHYRKLGRLVAAVGAREAEGLIDHYQQLLREALYTRATPGKHANVLHHAMGYFKAQLTGKEKQSLLEVIERFRVGELPLRAPLAQMRGLVFRFRQPYLMKQVYFTPYPMQLRLLGMIYRRR